MRRALLVAGTAILCGVAGAQDTRPPNKIQLEYEYEEYEADFPSWHTAGLEGSHRFGWGSLIGRVTWADRFADSGTQYEVDAYPKLGEKRYAYLNLGLSGSDVFPDLRWGVELYQGFSGGWEGSLGVRRLEFEDSNVLLWTGSATKYRGNWMFTLRPWYADKPQSSSLSGAFEVRRYFETAEDWLKVTAGYGETPDDDLTLAEVVRLDSARVRAEMQRRWGKEWLWKAALGLRNQEFRPGERRASASVSFAVARLF